MESAPALLNSSNWIAATLTGPLGAMLAVLAIAGVGFGMLQGRLAVGSGARIILGCFILFGAPVIARALSGAETQVSAQSDGAYSASLPAPTNIPTPTPPENDPYAGASVPL